MADEIAVIYQRYRRKKNTSEKNKSIQKYRRNTNSLMRPNKPARELNKIYYESSQENNEEVSCRVNNIMTAETFRDTKTRTTKRESVVFQKDARSFPTQEFLEILAKKRSSPEMNHTVREIKQNIKKRYSDVYFNPNSPYRTNFIVNTVMLNTKTLPPEWQRVFKHPIMQAPFRIYRCQLSTAEESCCCSCNSDAMFEVMKGLYDCYKKKNCDNCNCILCGHLAKEERKLAEKRKSQVAIGVETTSMKSMRQENIKKAKAAGLLTDLTGKSVDKKEDIIRGLANLGLPLPEGKTPSNIELLQKIRKQLGLPPEPKNAAERAKHDKAAKLGLLQPLEGKSKADKEKILQGLQDLGIELPEGRTPSEKSLIAKIKGAPKAKLVKSKAVGITAPSGLKPQISVGGTLSQKQRKARAQGFLTTLDGKSPEQKEKIIRGLAQSGLPLPEGKTESEKKLIEKVKNELKLTEPQGKLGPETALKAAATADKLAKAKAAGLLTPLDGKTPAQKEKILQGLAQAGIPLPEGKTASEKALIQKIKGETKPALSLKGISLEKVAKAKAAGLLTTLDGKTPEQKEKILRGLAQAGIPLPEGKTASEKALIQKIKGETKPALSLKGIPLEKVAKAKAAGFLTTLDGKTPEQKENILRGLAQTGIPLPKGKTPSEQKLIEKVRKDLGLPPGPTTDADKKKYENALSAGLITPLEGKTPEQKENILRGLAQAGIPLPQVKTASEKALIQKIKDETKPAISLKGLSPAQLAKAKAAGLLTPLDGKTPAQKEKILRGLAQAGIPLPEGKTASEKALIQKIKDETKPAISLKGLSPAQLAKAKAAGLLTTLDGKTPAQKEKILRGLAQAGIPLPEGKTASEKALIQKIKDETKPAISLKGLSPAQVAKAKAAGLLTPLDGKTPAQKEKILRGLAQAGIPLPEGKTASEKALIQKIKGETKPALSLKGIPPEKVAKAKAAGLLTTLDGKTPEQKEKILRGLANSGIPLPEGKTPSEQKLIEKVRKDLGLPPGPTTEADKKKYATALAAGLIVPLEGKTPEQKEKILRGLAQAGIPMPEGKTPSEKALIQSIQAGAKPEMSLAGIPSEKIRKARAAGLLTPLAGKGPEQKEKILRNLALNGVPLPEGKTASEKALIQKIKSETKPALSLKGISPEKVAKAKAAGLLTTLDGKTPEQKEKILRGLAQAGIPLPEGKTASEKALIQKIKGETKPALSLKGIPLEKVAKAKAAGFLTTLDGKTPEQKENILRGLAQTGIPLPKGKTPSEQKLIEKVRKDLGLPPGPTTDADKKKYENALSAGLITPLEGKTPEQKENILRGLAQAGIPLPQVKTASEKALIQKIKDETKPAISLKGLSPAQLAKAKAAGLLTPLDGKTPAQKEKILQGLAQAGIPLPEGKTASEKALIQKIKDETKPAISLKGLSPAQVAKAKAAGLLTPLDGKTPAQKEKILRGLAQAGIPLPEGKTASEKALIQKIKDETKPAISLKGLSPAQLAKAKAAGLLTTLDGKTPAQKEKILRGLAQAGIPLPEGKTASEKALIQKIKDETKPAISLKGLSPAQVAKAKAAGLLTPLDGKTPAQKEKILRGLAQAGIPLPEGKTASEKALIQKIKGETKPALSLKGIPPEKVAKAKAAGLLTTLDGKTPEQKEKILRGLANSGIPLPEGKTPSEQKLIEKVRKDLGLPPGPTTEADKKKYATALAAGLIVPLEGKTPEQKEKILRGLAQAGIPMPEGKTPSEKALIQSIQAGAKPEMSLAGIPSEKIRKARAAGLLTPLAGKGPEQKEKILRNLALNGVPLPEGKTPSEKALINKVRMDLGLPPEPKTPAERELQKKALIAGVLTPLEGKTPEQKEAILRKMIGKGIPLPEGRTASEKALINKIKGEVKSAASAAKSVSEKLRKAKEAGPVSPLDGKTSEQKKEILQAMADKGLPLPIGKTASDRALIDQIRSGQRPPLGSPALPPKERTALEEETAKVITEGKGPADECICDLLTPESERKSGPSAEKPTKTKSTGIPGLEGKTSEEKEKILKNLTKEPQGVISLEGKTPEEKEIALRKMKDAGLELPEGRTPSEKALINKIKASKLAAGIFTPLDGKSPAQKEKILKKMLAAGVPIPDGRTLSEKEIIKKVVAEAPGKSKPAGETKPADLPMSLKGKSPEEKENILRRQIQAGLPLPDNMTSSDKAIAKKVQDEDVKTKKDKLAGLSLTGKTKSAKSKILRELAEAGLPMPEGGTPSEKEMVKKARLAAGLSEVVTASEAKKFKDKKTGSKSIKKAMAARLGGAAAAAAGIQEEIQEIVKTDKCDAACGCDKKKIRFKHSYVKIRVTSPDISSFCPCPNECIPGVKAGVFTDNEGIKVTVGSVLCISSRNKQPTTAKTLQQSLMSTGNLPESQSLLLVKISSMVDDGSSVGLSSKSTVYIYNSESDVSISEIKRALRLNISNVCFEEYFDPTEIEKSLSYIYRYRFASNRKNVPDGYKRPHKPLINPRKSFLLVDAEPCLSLSSGSFCETNSLDILSSLARRLEYSSDSFGSQKSTYDDTDMFEPFYEETGLRPATTLLRNSISYVIKPVRNFGSRTELEDLYRLSEAKLTPRCHKPQPHYGRSIIELNQDTPSSRGSEKFDTEPTESGCPF